MLRSQSELGPLLGPYTKEINQKEFTPVKKENSFKPKKGFNGKDKAMHFTLLDPLNSSDSEEDLEEMVLETQVDILRLEREQDILDNTRRREGKETIGMEIQKDLKRDIHQAQADNDEANPSGKKTNNQKPIHQ